MDGFIPYRDCTNAFNLPPEEKMTAFVSSLLNKYKLTVTVGISGTGKTSFLNHFQPSPNWTRTLWERDKIFELLFNDGRRPESYYGSIDKFENDILPKVIIEDYHRVIVSGWNRMPRSRARYLSHIPKGLGRTCCLVFDGPIDRIVERNIEHNLERFGRSKEDLSWFLRQQHSTIQWPTHSEGFTDIIYINTFGEEGAEYLSEQFA